MHHVSLNIFQFALLLAFICVFSYHWTPKQSNTDEYVELLEKYNKTFATLKKYKMIKNRNKQEMDASESVVMGKHISAHSNSIRPSTENNSDERLIHEMMK